MKVDVRNDVAQVLSRSGSVSVVPVSTQQASQQNAAEEVGMLFSQQVEGSNKALSQRTRRAAATDVRVQKIQRIRQMAELYEHLGHPAQISLGQLSRCVRQELLSKPDVERLLALTGGDPTRTHVVLQHVIALAQAEGREHEAGLALDLQAHVHTHYARQIQAGLNTAQALKEAKGDPAQRQAVREAYYANVLGEQSVANILQALLDVFAEDDLVAGVRMMCRALADDMAAQRPSQPTSRLHTLLLGLQGCRQLSSVLNSCRLFIQCSLSWQPQAGHTAVSLLQRLLGYAHSGIDRNEVQCLGRELGGDQPNRQLSALNRIHSVLQSLPLALWHDDTQRQDTLQVFLLLMGQRTHDEGRVGPAGGRARDAQ